ncbi:MAG: PAS domain-containing protein [Xanthomonadaceae bacterium]|nr:PAS domain-containing protein [Xanthomonadaceae bacterium]
MTRTKLATASLDQLATGVARLDVDGRVSYANPAFIEHTGYGLSRILGQTFEVLKPDGDRLHAFALRAGAEHGTLDLPGVAVCPTPGNEVLLDFSFTPSDDGVWVETRPAGTASGATRVSESLRGFAHEIRNPLAAISGAAQLLEQRAGDARQRELAQLIRDESARLATLAERLLGARHAMATRAVNVHAMLERAAELLQAERGDVAIVRDYDPSLPAWHGDPDRLLQATLNLVRNAVEANAGRIVLRSRAEAGWRDAHGQRVPALRIEVEDDGDGIPDAVATTLFEPMVSGRADGTGLGLALAREIAREHGGELTLQRRQTGSCFVLLLPRHPRPGEHA